MTTDLRDRVVIVTGAAQGIGRAVAERCAAEGARVTAVDIDPRVSELEHLGIGDSRLCDVSDARTAKQICADVVSRQGAVHGLVNAAAVHVSGTAADTALEVWTRAMEVNVTAPFVWCQAVLEYMVPAKRGAIVNFGSVLSHRAKPSVCAYAVTKTAILGLTRSIAVDFGGVGVRCNTLSPGSVDTPMRQVARRGQAHAEMSSPIRDRLGEPAEIASLCAVLLSDVSSYMNGAEVVADGGRTALL